MSVCTCRKIISFIVVPGIVLCGNSIHGHGDTAGTGSFPGTSPVFRNVHRVRGVDDTDVVYAGTDGGVLKSGDNCGSWELLPVPGAAGKRMNMEIVHGAPVLSVPGGIYTADNKSGKLSFVPLGADMRVVGEKFLGMERGADMFLFDRSFLYSLHGPDAVKIGRLPGKGAAHDVIRSGDPFFVLSGEGVFASDDKGGSWEKIIDIRGGALEGEGAREDEKGFHQENVPGALRPAGAGKALLLTGNGISVLDASGVRRSVMTTGLPSAGVDSAIYRKGELLASTGREVFRYSFGGGGWRLFCSPSGSGNIRDMDIYRTSGGGYRFLLATADNIICMSLAAPAEVVDEVDTRRTRDLSEMPPIAEVHRLAIEYAEVAPEKIRRWRKGARWKALLPRLSVSYSESLDDNIDIYKNSSTSYVVHGPRERDNDWSVDMTWDLSDLIWNSEQTSIDVRSKLMVQLREDILEEVTRLYFQRKKLILEMIDEGMDGERSLRVRELTAYIDALTGGGFSEAVKAAAGE